jgi:DUF971 family protein
VNRPAPLEIKNSRTRRELVIQWSPEEKQVIPHQHLRGACPCSRCRAARLKGQIMLVEESVQLDAVNPFPYGVQLVFSDGHERGIYPWGFLWDMKSFAK